MSQLSEVPTIISVDGEDRIADFLARHGGSANRHEREGDMAQHSHGWSDVYAADGYKLHCTWSRVGSMTQMAFTEIAPL